MADKRISELPLAGTLLGSELLEIVQSSDNKRVTLNTAKSFIAELTVITVEDITHNETVTLGEKLIKVDCAGAGGDVTINLPTAVGNKSKIHIQKIDSTALKVIVDANGAQTINDEATKEIAFQHSCMTIVSDNANWRII